MNSTNARMFLWLGLVLALWLSFVLLAAPLQAAAETRLALVIGNSSYASGALANPRHDAEAIAKAKQIEESAHQRATGGGQR